MFMRKLSILLTLGLVFTIAWAQAPKRIVNDPSRLSKSERPLPLPALTEPATQAASPTGNTLPIGTVTSSAVTATKIAESANTFGSLVNETNQVWTVPGTGSNGGAVSFLFRVNPTQCGGNSGIFRYVLSSNGGSTWDVGAATVPPAFNGCYGKGPVNPANTRPGRYPNAVLFPRGNSSSMDSLALVYAAPVLQTSGSGWDGWVAGSVTRAATMTPVVSQESYQQQGGNQYFTYSLVHQIHPTTGAQQFWFLSRSWDGTNVGTTFLLNKGVWNSSTRQVTWSLVQTINLPYSAVNTTNAAAASAIAFDPTGTKGYIGFLSDLTGGTDSVFSPVFMESTDGGDTWGAPIEIDIEGFAGLREHLILNSPLVIVTTSTGTDTVPFSRGKPTCAFDMDIEVDALGNPHMLVVVGNGGTVTSPAAYSIFSGLELEVYDVTKDLYGDWNMLQVADQFTLRGTFGDPNVTSGSFTADPYVQVTRSADGTKIFYSWTDSDTVGTGLTSNQAPDLIGRAFDVIAQKLTPVENWTKGDLNWATKVLLPKTSNIALHPNSRTWKVPTVIANLDNGNAISQTSYWYFSDITYDSIDFNEDPVFFYNCKENAYANTLTPTNATCGLSDGTMTLAVSGGVGPFTYAWSNGASTQNLGNLAPGIYTVTVTDSKGCEDILTANVINAGAPALALGAVTNPACFGQNNGAATVSATGGTGTLTYNWSCAPGNNSPTATGLSGGSCTVTVTDANNCASILSFNLTTPPAIVLNTNNTNILCNGDNNGTASVTLLAGGAGSLGVAWAGPGGFTATGNSLNGLRAGTYVATATDANGCTVSSSVTIAEPARLAVSLSPVEPSDPTACDGIITAAATGGTAPYAYLWSNGANSAFNFGLCNGTFTVTVTDANGCTSIQVTRFAVSIDKDLAAGVNSFNLMPNPNNGQFSIELALAQRSEVAVEVLNTQGQMVFRRNLGVLQTAETAMNLSHLSAGIYLVRVKTALGEVSRKLVIR